MKKIILFMLVWTMFGTIIIDKSSAEETQDIQRLNNEILALEQYELLLKNLSEENSFSITRNITPDYYGGSYINDDGNLVVCVTSDYPTNSNLIQTYTMNDGVITQSVDHTYNTLLQAQEQITEVYETIYINMVDNSYAQEENSELISSLCGSYIDTKNNELIVEIENLDMGKIECFKKLFIDAPYIRFIEGKSVMDEKNIEDNSFATPLADDGDTGGATFLNAGSRIWNIESDAVYGGSIGYPVYFTDTDGVRKRGFITAGHVIESVADSLYLYENNQYKKIGTCVATRNSGDTDAALIRLENGYAMSQVTEHGTVISTRTYVFVLQGATIFKEGATTNYRSGEVLAENYSFYSDGKAYTDMYKTTVLSCDGDSGGIVYNGIGRVVGSIHGSNHNGAKPETEFTFEYSLIVKADNTLNTFSSFNCSITS